MKKYIIGVLWILLVAIAGCGKSKEAGNESATAMEKEAPAEWRTEGFAVPKELEKKQSLWAGEYLPWEHGEEICADYGVCGDLFWCFKQERQEGDAPPLQPDRKYVIEIYDTVKGEFLSKSFTPKDLGLEGQGFFGSMDMLDRNHFVLRYLSFGQNEDGLYYQIADNMVYTNLSGEAGITDLWTSYVEKELVKEKVTELPLQYVFDWCSDSAGNIYLIKQAISDTLIYVWNKSGELLLEQKVDGTLVQGAPFRTPEGEMILATYGKKGYVFWWIDTAGKEMTPLVQIETSVPYFSQIYGMIGNEIYYKSSEEAETGIVCWNIKEGSKVQVMSFESVGFLSGQQTMLALIEGQTPCLRIIKSKGQNKLEWFTRLTKEKAVEQDAIRIVDFTNSGEIVEKAAAQASMEKPNVRYQYENASAQEAKDRILAELTKGEGPDFLFVREKDLSMLAEKGALLELGEFLPKELQEELLPGALGIGTVDGKLYGIPTAITANTLLVSADVWNGDTWNLEDVIGLMEEGKLTGALRSPFLASQDYLTPFLTVKILISNSLADSFLIDWDNKVSHFDDERFIRLLELTSEDMSRLSVSNEDWLDEGRSVAWGSWQFVFNIIDLVGYMEKENGKQVGYPTNGVSGNYISSADGILVVNANTERKEEIADFLELLLSDELQTKNGKLSVKKLCPEDYIVETEDGRLLYMGDERLRIPVFQDGSTALDKAKIFLEKCVAQPPAYTQIDMILTEELSAMYAEDKSPEMTAEIIHRRVQVYLDEEK